MSEAEKITNRTVRAAVLVRNDGTLDDCIYCKGKKSLVFTRIGANSATFRCTVCQEDWVFHDHDAKEFHFQPAPADLNKISFLELCLNYEKYQSLYESYSLDNKWAFQFMELKGWEWICICGGDVVGGSSNVRDIPTMERKLVISQKNRGLIPICLSNKPVRSEQYPFPV